MSYHLCTIIATSAVGPINPHQYLSQPKATYTSTLEEVAAVMSTQIHLACAIADGVSNEVALNNLAKFLLKLGYGHRYPQMGHDHHYGFRFIPETRQIIYVEKDGCSIGTNASVSV